jgi:serine/threonine-protein kinase
MATTLRCPACNADLEPNDRFCGKCGATLPPTPTTPTEQVAASADTPATDAAQDEQLEAALKEAIAPRYQLVRRLGTGGMGSVFLAREPALKRLVAVKVLSPALAANPTARARFQREAQAVAGISHPNVVSVYAVGELADGTPYFVMQHVSGESLASRIEREGPVAPAEARRMLGQTASALAAAHAKGIIHRDIKPANVLYDEESGRVLVTDFGIAAVLPASEAEAPSHLTGTGMAIGTPQYMSPEQLLAEKVTDRTDIYSLGLLAYDLLTGAGPFAVSSPVEIAAAHLRDTPRRLSELKPDVDHELESLVAACLRKNAQERPTAADLTQRLGAADTVLEWPPPGLDALLGRSGKLTRDFGLASTMFTLPLLLMVGFGPWLAATAAGILLLILVLASLGGAILLVLAVRQALRLGGEMSRAVRTGYGWLTVAEVLADHRGDTGALIAGTREYAALSPDARDRFRSARVSAALARVLASAVAGPALVLAFVVGPRGAAGTTLIPAVVLLPVLVLMVLGAWLGAQESRSLRAARSGLRRRPTAGTSGQFVRAWYESFEAARHEQRHGPGPRTRPALGRLATVALAVGIVGAAVLVIPVLVVSAVGPVFWRDDYFRRYILTDVPVSPWQRRVELTAAARRYRLPTDPAITPLAAGRAMVSVTGAPPRTGLRPLLGLPSGGPDWFPGEGMHLFDFGRGVGIGASLLYQTDTLIARAVHGFTPAQSAYLMRVAANPGFDALRILAHAPGLDGLGATYALPFPDSATWSDLRWVPFVSTRDAGRASVARAALLLSQGRREEAETAIRETISFGLLLMDEAMTPFDLVVGNVVAGTGRNALLAFYEVTGRTQEAHALRAARDTAVSRYLAAQGSGQEQANPYVLDVPALRRLLIGEVQDSSLTRALRWSMLHNLMYVQCSNAREVMVGPDADLRAAAAVAKQALVRYPSDSAMFTLVEATAERFQRRDLPPGIATVLFDAARFSGTLLRNHRIAGCLAPVLYTLFRPE